MQGLEHVWARAGPAGLRSALGPVSSAGLHGDAGCAAVVQAGLPASERISLGSGSQALPSALGAERSQVSTLRL